MIAALLLFSQIASAPEQPRPLETSIAAIRANPKKFDGELVRLHGWVNRCQALSCSIEERAANSAGGPGSNLSIAEDDKFESVIRPLLPTYVEFDARVNAACLIAQVCPDRSPELTIVTLRSVVSTEPPIEN